MKIPIPVWRPIVAALTLSTLLPGLAQTTAPMRPADVEVNDATLRTTAGLAPNTNLLFNGWGVTPAGNHVRISDLPLKMIVSPDKKTLLAASGGFNDTGLSVLDIATQQRTQFFPLPEVWNGLAFSADGRRIFVGGGDSGQIYQFSYVGGKVKSIATNTPAPDEELVFLAGIVVHPKSGKIYVCNEANHEIWVLNPETLSRETTITVGEHPHSCIFGADERHLYVSNWGGRSVSVVDTVKNRRVRDIPVGIRPNDLALSKDGRLFVACSGDNTVHVIQTKALEDAGEEASPARRLPENTREIISTSLYPQSPEGSTPDAVAVSPDGKTLFVANADNNSVLVVDISNSLFEDAQRNGESVSLVNGFIPVGWYPSAVCVSPDSQTLFVGNGKGLASRANFPSTDPAFVKKKNRNKSPAFDYIPRTLEGSVSFIARPDPAQMAAYTKQVRRNSPYTPEALHRAPIHSASIIPDQVGQACPIKHVLYIIKENRTYDQVFGDLTNAAGQHIGNGDPALTIYGESVTPNHHQLARDYVLLDNLYCNSEVSVDGHSWCDAAMATDFNQRSWIISYSKHGVLPGNAEMETPSAGYLWDLCKRNGVTFKTYGEGSRKVPSVNRGRWVGARDMNKVNCWIEDLQTADKTGELPQFMIMSLGEDHTKGTTPDAFTPEASVASNDLGLGRLVEAASRSKFWNELAIFVIEDDAQNGPDHVDAHRTVGLVISPYCKRGVDSTMYSTASMVRTMELILGLPPLTQYDAGATPMFNCFASSAQAYAFNAITPGVNLTARNTLKSPGAKESAGMNFREYDRAPEEALNQILWAEAKGPGVPYPAPIHRAVFTSALTTDSP